MVGIKSCLESAIFVENILTLSGHDVKSGFLITAVMGPILSVHAKT